MFRTDQLRSLIKDTNRPHTIRIHLQNWTSEPERFIVDPIHQMPGLNT